ncbi:MAG: hypothetical protein WCF07_06470 [Nitrososphaeraceae archaeon]
MPESDSEIHFRDRLFKWFYIRTKTSEDTLFIISLKFEQHYCRGLKRIGSKMSKCMDVKEEDPIILYVQRN